MSELTDEQLIALVQRQREAHQRGLDKAFAVMGRIASLRKTYHEGTFYAFPDGRTVRFREDGAPYIEREESAA